MIIDSEENLSWCISKHCLLQGILEVFSSFLRVRAYNLLWYRCLVVIVVVKFMHVFLYCSTS